MKSQNVKKSKRQNRSRRSDVAGFAVAKVTTSKRQDVGIQRKHVARERPFARRGMLLVVVLVVISLFALVAASFSYWMQSELELVHGLRSRQQARLAAESGLARVMLLLRDQRTNMDSWYNNREAFRRILVWAPDRIGGSLSLADQEAIEGQPAWRFSVVATEYEGENPRMRYGLVDETSKLNLNTATREQLLTLFGELELRNVTPEQLTNALIDWRDSDDEVTPPSGAESGYYMTLDPPYRAKNKPLDTVEELLTVRYFNGRILYGEDYNRNDCLDPNEDDGPEGVFPPDDGDGLLDRGLLPFVTVYSWDMNSADDNKPRLNLNAYRFKTVDDLPESLIDVFSPEFVEFLAEAQKRGYKFRSVGELLGLQVFQDGSSNYDDVWKQYESGRKEANTPPEGKAEETTPSEGAKGAGGTQDKDQDGDADEGRGSDSKDNDSKNGDASTDKGDTDAKDRGDGADEGSPDADRRGSGRDRESDEADGNDGSSDKTRSPDRGGKTDNLEDEDPLNKNKSRRQQTVRRPRAGQENPEDDPRATENRRPRDRAHPDQPEAERDESARGDADRGEAGQGDRGDERRPRDGRGDRGDERRPRDGRGPRGDGNRGDNPPGGEEADQAGGEEGEDKATGRDDETDAGTGQGDEAENTGDGSGKGGTGGVGGGGKKKSKGTPVVSPVVAEDMPLLMDRLTVAQNPIQRGLINVNTAPVAVLKTIPGLTEEEALAIASRRGQLNAEEKKTPAWLVTAGVLPPERFAVTCNHVTARSIQFTVDVIGFADHVGTVDRIQAVVEMQGQLAQIKYFRDVTRLGIGYPLDGDQRSEAFEFDDDR